MKTMYSDPLHFHSFDDVEILLDDLAGYWKEYKTIESYGIKNEENIGLRSYIALIKHIAKTILYNQTKADLLDKVRQSKDMKT